MIDLARFGYKSRAAFLRDPAPSGDTFEVMANDKDWIVQKSVLLHPACPTLIRDKFATDPVWFKRFVAYFASKAPNNYWRKAERDMERNIQRAFKARLEHFRGSDSK